LSEVKGGNRMDRLEKAIKILNVLKGNGYSMIYYYHYSQEATDILKDLMLIRG
jgi:hypothetical protein